MIILVLTVLSGFLLASSPTACVKRSNLPQNRISKCKTPVGIELPEEYCEQKLDYCESSFNTFLPNPLTASAEPRHQAQTHDAIPAYRTSEKNTATARSTKKISDRLGVAPA